MIRFSGSVSAFRFGFLSELHLAVVWYHILEVRAQKFLLRATCKFTGSRSHALQLGLGLGSGTSQGGNPEKVGLNFSLRREEISVQHRILE